MSIVRSPQAPEDLLPVPWQQRPLSDVGFPAKAIEFMRTEYGVTHLGVLHTMRRTNHNFKLTDCPGVGASTAAKIEQAIEAYTEMEES